LGITRDHQVEFMDEKKVSLYTFPLASVKQYSEKKLKKFIIEIDNDSREYEGDKIEIQGLVALFNEEMAVLQPSAPQSQFNDQVNVEPAQSTPTYIEPVQPKQPPKIAKAIYDYTPNGEGELSISENENLLVLDDSDPDWWLVRSMKKGGGEGYVPQTYVEVNFLV
jgi:hypothetical protein